MDASLDTTADSHIWPCFDYPRSPDSPHTSGPMDPDPFADYKIGPALPARLSIRDIGIDRQGGSHVVRCADLLTTGTVGKQATLRGRFRMALLCHSVRRCLVCPGCEMFQEFREFLRLFDRFKDGSLPLVSSSFDVCAVFRCYIRRLVDRGHSVASFCTCDTVKDRHDTSCPCRYLSPDLRVDDTEAGKELQRIAPLLRVLGLETSPSVGGREGLGIVKQAISARFTPVSLPRKYMRPSRARRSQPGSAREEIPLQRLEGYITDQRNRRYGVRKQNDRRVHWFPLKKYGSPRKAARAAFLFANPAEVQRVSGSMGTCASGGRAGPSSWNINCQLIDI